MLNAALMYVRTTQGRITAFSPETKLSPALKTLLKAADGKTSTDNLISKFETVGDVAELLQALESMGLIAGKNTTDPSLEFGTMAALQPDDHTSHNWEQTAAASLDELPPAQHATLMDSMVLQLVDQMCTFVLTYLPEKAFAVLQTIEKIQTSEQLVASFPGYEMLAKPVGRAGEDHLREMQQVISKLFVN